MSSFRSTPLFGGALIVDLPSTFADVSTIRQVPDHQEVYLDKDGFTSIIFDITERVGTAGSGPAVDGAALTTHLEDIVDSDVDTVKVWNTSNTQFSKLPFVPLSSRTPILLNREGIPAYTLIATQTPPPAPDSKSPDFTAIVLTLIRLERESTDVLITINVPHIKGEYTQEEVDMEMGKQGKLIESSVEIAARIWETFKIKDWGLFNEV
ncbi:putative ran guanine nucleotide release factor [Lachnellula hyalina]|uniref:Putative ran guanine nucleotide release factor n=1 Tax=Lachnellula hyalina TaxID=1316788 RepID=A0A8H8QZV5_9HELO|nr:putative ran guanine nucleotide release factor [Lachnellula hyalina]TVY24825.1 putative ran guanine nucleotide release factor [Lachnellula hyalina]